MKKIFIFAAAAMVMATACNKNTTPVVGAIPSDGNDDPVAIKFGTNVHTDATKAPVEAWDTTQTLYVFGCPRTNFSAATPSNLSKDKALIKGVAAIAPDGGTKGDIVVLNPVDTLPFYYAYANNTYTTYDFYGCYFDNAADTTKIHMEKTEIYVDFKIDGTQDLMIAAANRESDVNAGSVDQDKIKHNPNYAYSGFSARYGVKPNLVFNHCLTRFDIKIENCSNENVIQLDGLKFSSITEGKLVIATIAEGDTTGVHPTGATAENLAIKVTDGDEVLNPGDATDPRSIMVIPANGHEISVYFSQLTPNGKYKEQEPISHTITPANVADEEGNSVGVTEFEVGKRYNVLVKIYGLEKVEITVELAPWVDGGSIVIDPDKNPFNE